MVCRRIFALNAKKVLKSFGVPQSFAIFAASNQTSGMRTAGPTSGLFCAPTYKKRNIFHAESGSRQCPGVSARLDLTARSVDFLCQIQTSYVNNDDYAQCSAPDGPPGEPDEEHHQEFYYYGIRPRSLQTRSRCLPGAGTCLVACAQPHLHRPLRRGRRGVHPWRGGEGESAGGLPVCAAGGCGMRDDKATARPTVACKART